MSSSFRKSVEKVAGQFDSDRLPCGWCQTATLRETLSQYGARCLPCYEAYCAEGLKGGSKGFMQGRPDTDQQAAMRKRVKHGGAKAPDALKRGDDMRPEEIEAAKRRSAQQVAAYAAKTGAPR